MFKTSALACVLVLVGTKAAFGSLNTQGQTYSLGLAHQFTLAGVSFSPFAGVNYQQLSHSAYEEKDSQAVFPLYVSAGHANIISAVVGVKAQANVSDVTQLSLQLSALEQLNMDKSLLNSSVGGFSMLAGFDSAAALKDDDYATSLKLNLTQKVSRDHRLEFGFDVRKSLYYQKQDVSFGMGWMFGF